MRRNHPNIMNANQVKNMVRKAKNSSWQENLNTAVDAQEKFVLLGSPGH